MQHLPGNILGNKRGTFSLHSYQTYVRVRDQVLGSTPLLFKYCPVVLEAKIEESLYPLHRLYLSTAVLL